MMRWMGMLLIGLLALAPAAWAQKDTLRMGEQLGAMVIRPDGGQAPHGAIHAQPAPRPEDVPKAMREMMVRLRIAELLAGQVREQFERALGISVQLRVNGQEIADTARRIQDHIDTLQFIEERLQFIRDRLDRALRAGVTVGP